MEKFYTIPKTHSLAKDYKSFQQNMSKINNLYIEFAKENGIETTTAFAIADRLEIEPTKNDIVNFKSHFLSGYVGKFKKTSPLCKKWIALCKENKLTNHKLTKPFVSFYFDRLFERNSYRLFIHNDTLYCWFECSSDFDNPNGFIEIKGSEFYKVLEEANSQKKDE